MHEALLSAFPRQQEVVAQIAQAPRETRVANQLRLLVTGSRTWEDAQALYGALDLYWYFAKHRGLKLKVIHGACYPREIKPGKRPFKSADWMAHLWCGMSGVEDIPVKAEWWKHGDSAGPIRNRRMSHMDIDLCLALPRGESKGTHGCARMAQEAGIPVAWITSGEEAPAE
jgi:hypothetical protein